MSVYTSTHWILTLRLFPEKSIGVMQVQGEHNASMQFVRDLFENDKEDDIVDFLINRNRGMELNVGGSRQAYFCCLMTNGLVAVI